MLYLLVYLRYSGFEIFLLKMPTNRPRISIQFESEELKEACEVYVEDKNLKSMSALINMALIELLTKEKYYKPGQPPKRLK